jgi:hypothetical protein
LHDDDSPNNENDNDEYELSSSEQSFPWKLHLMLAHAEKKKYHNFISWVKDGSAFIEKVMPIYFVQTKFKSFRWQLNLYGFTPMSHGEDHSVTLHPSFVKGAQCLCENIRGKLLS